MVTIAVVGNGRKSDHPIFTRIPEALHEAAAHLKLELNLLEVSTADLVSTTHLLEQANGLFGSPNPYMSTEGFLNSVTFARTRQVPWLGACSGFQYALVEFARSRLGLSEACHVEAHPEADFRFVDFLPDHLRVPNEGPWKFFDVCLVEGSLAADRCRTPDRREAFYANYSLSPKHKSLLENSGLNITGTYRGSEAACLFELESHPFFVGCLFQPQLTSTAQQPHPLITAFLEKAQQRCLSRR